MRVDGVVFLDKPAGISSNGAVQRVRRLYQADRAGHTGTLDPLASGVLPIVLGDAAKFGEALLEADKEYVASVLLGVRTATADAEGDIVAVQPVPELSTEALEACLARFRGRIEQVPPMYSALKRHGRPLYDYARRGQVVERAARPVTIHLLELQDRQGAEIGLRVRCSKGTYVRTLAEDIGEAIGCGAHLRALCRTAIGSFRLDGCVPLATLESAAAAERDRHIRPADVFLSALPRVDLTAAQSARLQQGQAVEPAEFGAFESLGAAVVRAYGPGGRFLGLADCRAGTLHGRRLVRVDSVSRAAGAGSPCSQ